MIQSLNFTPKLLRGGINNHKIAFHKNCKNCKKKRNDQNFFNQKRPVM